MPSSKYLSHLLIGFLLFAGLLTLPKVGECADLQKMQAAYQKANDLYDQKKYKNALRYFEIAYKNLPKKGLDFARNELRYFLGLCHYKLKHYAKAKIFLQQHLLNNPKPERKKELKGIIAKIDEKLPKKRRVVEVIKKKKKAPAYRPPVGSFVLLASGAALVIGGAILGSMANESVTTFKEKADNQQFGDKASEVKALVQQAEGQATFANLLWGAGGAALFTGGAMLLSKTPKKIKKFKPVWLGASGNVGVPLISETTSFRASLFGGYRFMPLFSEESGLGIGLQAAVAFGDNLLHVDALPTLRLDVPMNLLGVPLGAFARIGAGVQYVQTQTCSSDQATYCTSENGIRFAARISGGFRYTVNRSLNILFEPLGFSLAWGNIQSVSYSVLLGAEILL